MSPEAADLDVVGTVEHAEENDKPDSTTPETPTPQGTGNWNSEDSESGVDIEDEREW